MIDLEAGRLITAVALLWIASLLLGELAPRLAPFVIVGAPVAFAWVRARVRK